MDSTSRVYEFLEAMIYIMQEENRLLRFAGEDMHGKEQQRQAMCRTLQ